MVDCEQSPAKLVPPIPGLESIDEWVAEMIGIYHVEVLKRKSEDKCLSDLRSAGVIR